MSIINLTNVETISRGDTTKRTKYLQQFVELIPDRCSELNKALQNDNRLLIRQILHKMGPQLLFFGIQEVIFPIRKIEYEYETMEYDALCDVVTKIVRKLEVAVEEVEQLL